MIYVGKVVGAVCLARRKREREKERENMIET
jgi:hypothetical protein